MSSLIACGQSRQIADASGPGDTGGEGTAFAGAAGDAAHAKSGSGGADSGGDGQAGNAGAAAGSQGGNASVEETQGGNAGADETQGGRAGEGDGPSAAGAGGAEVAVCNTGVAKLSVEDAEAAVRAQAGGESSLSLTELEIASAWERLEIQIFVSNSSVPGITDAFAFQGGHLWGRLPSGMAGLRSALVADDALFYTFASGSGVMRAHVVRLSLVNCVLELLESGGYTRSGYLDLYLREDMGELSVESGVFVGFNQWSDGQLYGRLVSAATSLSIVDAMGMIIEPEFPPTM